jgi:hypothetical protein
MEEFAQRLLRQARQAPQWVWRVLTVCCLSGLTLKYLHDLFGPLIDGLLTHVIDPSQISVTSCTFASLAIVGPVWFVVYLADPNRPEKRRVLGQVDIIESAMERVGLPCRSHHVL